MAGLAHRSFAILGILAFASGCDNVEWGGASVALQPPPPAIVGATPDDSTEVEVDSTEAPPPPLPVGPVLYLGTRSGSRVSLLPLFEFRGDTLLPLTDEAEAPGFDAHFARTLLAPGNEFVLFADGVRVGTLVADTVGTSAGWCRPRPTAVGTPELIPSAGAATRFLALARSAAPATPHADGAFPAMTADLDRAARLMAQADIQSRGALWPDDLAQARADAAAIRTGPGAPAGVAATFMFRDRLAVEDPGTPVAYSLFVMGFPGDDGRVRLDYSWYRRVGDDGKGAPRFVQAFDWDADGATEVLLEVLGTASRWPAVVEGSGEDWTLAWENRCTPGVGSAGG